jgi:hypothetical protein
VKPNPERTYRLVLPRLVSEVLDVLFAESLEYVRDDHFGPALDEIYTALRETPGKGTVVGQVTWLGKTYDSWVFTTGFLRAVYIIDEEKLEVTIYVPIELMPGRSFDE